MAESSQKYIADPGPNWIKEFFPGYFALVMATGIVSLAWHFQGFERIAKALFWLNVSIYLFLWVVTAVRFARFRTALVNDLVSHVRGATFLTMVAATCVLGKQFATLTSFATVAQDLWLFAVLLWFLLIYTFFTAITVREPKPTLETGINGSWLLAVVATESLCTLGTMIAPSFARPDLVLFLSLIAYALGAMFYIILITLILYRWFFFSMGPNTLTPPYWINMGALAITTLGGARLLTAAQAHPILEPFRPFVTGFTIFFWSTATWWIPMLIVVGFWRHGLQKVPIKYDPQYWSLVFPLGMYSVSTFVFAETMHWPFLRTMTFIFAIAGLGAWCIAFIGMLRQIRLH